MSEKVTIPRDVANMIEALRSDDHYGPARDNEYICELAMRTGGGVPIATSTLRKIPFDMLLQALVNGYEREKEPYEAVRALYRGLVESERKALGIYGSDPYQYAFAARTVQRTLNALKIAIPGVNAPEETEEPAHV